MVAHLSAKAYPDNWFSIGVVPREKKRTADKEHDRDYSEQFNSYTRVVRKGYKYEIEEVSWLEGQIEPSNRFISSLKSSQRKMRYGQNGITSNGKRTVKGASALLQKTYGKDRLGFGTLSIPNYSKEKVAILCHEWGEVVRVFFQKLKREIEKVGGVYHMVGVTEIQPKRYRTHGVCAPHIHFAYVAKEKKNAAYYVSAGRFRELWRETLICRVGDETGIENVEMEWGAAVHVVSVKQSVGGYLGKYITKGCSTVEQVKEDGRNDELPRHWWTISSVWRREYKKSIKKLNDGATHLLFYHPDQALSRGLIRWYKEVWIEFDGEERLFGVVGYFTSQKEMHVCTR